MKTASIIGIFLINAFMSKGIFNIPRRERSVGGRPFRRHPAVGRRDPIWELEYLDDKAPRVGPFRRRRRPKGGGGPDRRDPRVTLTIRGI